MQNAETMKAYVRTSAEDQQVELVEMPIPEVADDEVLVKIEAIGVGIHDRYFIPSEARFPYIIGIEASGIIAKTGTEVTSFQIQDRVILMSVLLPKGGCWAEYVAVSQKTLIPMPDEMAFTEGAIVPVASNTSLDSMHALDLKKGDTLFVAGASGAIGTLIIQLAAKEGIRVIGSASQRNHEHMLALGAEKAVDYSDPNWKQSVKDSWPNGASAALAIQPGTAADCLDVVKDGGKVVTVSGDQIESERNISVYQFEHREEVRTEVIKLIDDIVAGRIRQVIEETYSFPNALDALEKTETRHARGKVVVSLSSDL